MQQNLITLIYSNLIRQESPAVADKPARCETMPKIAAVRP